MLLIKLKTQEKIKINSNNKPSNARLHLECFSKARNYFFAKRKNNLAGYNLEKIY